MPSERDNAEERQLRLNGMIEKFRAARQRRLLTQGMALWKSTQTEMEHRALDAKPAPAPTKH